MLPIHSQPRPNEILYSRMVRLAFANGFPLHSFYSALPGYKAPIWNRDTDRHPSPALLETLSRFTDQLLPDLQALTLSAYDGILLKQLPAIGDAFWIPPVGVFHRTRKRTGIQYCPLFMASRPLRHMRAPLLFDAGVLPRLQSATYPSIISASAEANGCFCFLRTTGFFPSICWSISCICMILTIKQHHIYCAYL